MSFALAFLNTRSPVHRQLMIASAALCCIDAILLLVFVALIPHFDPPLVLGVLIVFNCVYAPVVAILRRKRRRTRSVWSLLSGKVLSLSAALCLWEVVHDSGVEDVGHPVAMGVVLALLQLLYIVDIAVYLWVLRIASRGQADRAFRYAKFYMIDRLKHGHASATSVAAGVQEELKLAAQRVQLAHNIARQAVEAKFRTALNQLEERLQATEGGDASTRAVRTAFREVEEETTSAFSRSAAVFTSLRKSMSDMRLMARKDFTSIIVRLSLARHHFAFVATFVLLLSFSAFFLETVKIGSQQEPIFTPADVAAMRDASNAYRAGGVPTRLAESTNLHSDNKVMIVIMDGLRFDHVGKLAFWETSEYQTECATRGGNCVAASDVAVFRARCQLPSMSVPNWLTTLTGAPPEMTGVLGNIFVPDTHFDSIYSSAKHADVMRMITGTPWFAGIVANQLPFLRGDGTIDAAYNTEETVADTSAPSDLARLGVALDALEETNRAGAHTNYRLMLTHFSDIDSQGHCCGVTKAANEEDTYNAAIATKAEHLQQMLEAMEPDTVAIIVADHGHVDVGGHGGIAHELRDIPLLVYKRGSGLAAHGEVDVHDVDVNAVDNLPEATVSNIDIAPTVCALLGIAVPGQVTGSLIRPVLDHVNISATHRQAHWDDLYTAMWHWMDNFRQTWASSSDVDMPSADTCHSVVSTKGHCAEEVAALQALYRDELRPEAKFKSPIWLALLFALVLATGCVFLLEFTTIASPLSVCFSRNVAQLDVDVDEGSKQASTPINAAPRSTTAASARARAAHAASARSMGVAQLRQLEQSRRIAESALQRSLSGFVLNKDDKFDMRMRNRVALLWTLGGTFMYYAVSLGFYNVFYFAKGYERWDSTVIHSPVAAQRWLLVVLVPSTIAAFVFVRSYNVFYHVKPQGEWRSTWTLRVRQLFTDTYAHFSDSVTVYLIDQYLLLTATICCLVTLVLASDFTFAFPGVLQQPFVDPSTWAYRFRVITMLGLNLPIVVVALYKTWSWDWENVPRDNLGQFLNAQGVALPDKLFTNLELTGSPIDEPALSLSVRGAPSRGFAVVDVDPSDQVETRQPSQHFHIHQDAVASLGHITVNEGLQASQHDDLASPAVAPLNGVR